MSEFPVGKLTLKGLGFSPNGMVISACRPLTCLNTLFRGFSVRLANVLVSHRFLALRLNSRSRVTNIFNVSECRRMSSVSEEIFYRRKATTDKRQWRPSTRAAMRITIGTV